MRVLNTQEVLAVTGATGCKAKPVCAPKLPCLPKHDLLAGLIAKIKACKPVKPTCPTTTTPPVVDTPADPVEDTPAEDPIVIE